MPHRLEEFITRSVKLNEKELAQIIKLFRLQRFSKGDLILSKGEVPNYFYFVAQGCLRVYCLQPDGKEFTRYIAFEGMFGTSFPGFIKQNPSNAFVDALEFTEALAISYYDFQLLLKESLAFERVYRLILERSYVDSILRIEELISLGAKERYQKILKEMPYLIQRLPNRILANYMGISPETLSRLKADY